MADPRDVFRAIIDNAPIGIWLLGMDGRLVFVNRTYCDGVGISEAEFLAAPHYASLYDPVTADGCMASDAEALASAGLHYSYERVSFTDGRMHELEIMKFRLDDKAGTPSGVVGLSLDITERKAVEGRFRLMASVFENAQEGVILTDPDGAILDVNPSFTRITGYDRDEVVGKNPRILNSGRHHPEFFRELWTAVTTTGRWNGEIWNRRKDGGVYPEWLGISAVRDDAGRTTRFVGVFTDISRLKRQEQELQRLAHHDALTGLPNRVLLADRMTQAIAMSRRTGRLMAVAYLDLDAFKPVNDRFGHTTGDALLAEVARRLAGAVRAGDTVARLGGDEFVLLLPDLGSFEECTLALRRVLSIVAEPMPLLGQDVTVTLTSSIGVSLYPQDDVDPDELLRHADQAMYQAKREGRNRVHLFDPIHHLRARVDRERLDRLRQALAEGELELYYQPKVNMRTGDVLGVEGLARWRHPERGLLRPAEFLPDIEGTELEVPFGEWAIGTALDQAGVWMEAGMSLPVCVNVGAQHLLSDEFVPRLERALADRPMISADQLQLEILESISLRDLLRAGEVVEAGHRLGVSFAIDDFGTGYSSLTYLRRLPIEVLKIDQSFVQNMLKDAGDLVIVDGVIALGEAFGRTVVAEGVETVEHGLALLRLGCEIGQGYGISPPMPAGDVASWASTWRPDPRWKAERSSPYAAADLPLLVVGQQHREWLEKLSAHVQAPSSVSEPPIQPSACPVGRWISGAGRLRHAHRPEFVAVDSAHEAIHELGRKIVGLSSCGAGADATALMPELERQSGEFLEKLQRLQQTVIG